VEGNDQELVQKYREYQSESHDYERKLENLRKTKDQVTEDRYATLEKDYEANLRKIQPELENLGKEIQSRIDGLTGNLKDVKAQIAPLDEDMEQEKKLYKAGAISRDEYSTKIAPLTQRRKELDHKRKQLKSQSNYLRTALSQAEGPLYSRDRWKDWTKRGGVASGSEGIEGDLKTGMKYFLLIALALFVGLPLGFIFIFFAFKIGIFIGIPVLFVFLLLVLIAVFGRGINFLRNKW